MCAALCGAAGRAASGFAIDSPSPPSAAGQIAAAVARSIPPATGEAGPSGLGKGVALTKEGGCQKPLRLESESRRQPQGSHAPAGGDEGRPRAAVVLGSPRSESGARHDADGRPRVGRGTE